MSDGDSEILYEISKLNRVKSLLESALKVCSVLNSDIERLLIILENEKDNFRNLLP